MSRDPAALDRLISKKKGDLEAGERALSKKKKKKKKSPKTTGNERDTLRTGNQHGRRRGKRFEIDAITGGGEKAVERGNESSWAELLRNGPETKLMRGKGTIPGKKFRCCRNGKTPQRTRTPSSRGRVKTQSRKKANRCGGEAITAPFPRKEKGKGGTIRSVASP